jgi:hypothetical protein
MIIININKHFAVLPSEMPGDPAQMCRRPQTRTPRDDARWPVSLFLNVYWHQAGAARAEQPLLCVTNWCARVVLDFNNDEKQLDIVSMAGHLMLAIRRNSVNISNASGNGSMQLIFNV